VSRLRGGVIVVVFISEGKKGAGIEKDFQSIALYR